MLSIFTFKEYKYQNHNFIKHFNNFKSIFKIIRKKFNKILISLIAIENMVILIKVFINIL